MKYNPRDALENKFISITLWPDGGIGRNSSKVFESKTDHIGGIQFESFNGQSKPPKMMVSEQP